MVASSAQCERASKLVRADVGRMNDSIFQAVTVQLSEVWRLSKQSHADRMAKGGRY
jgi:hypothetical protein